MPVRDVEERSQHIADAVARAHRDTARERAHREPCAYLAVEARLEILGVSLNARQPAGQQRQAVKRLRVSKGIRLVRADALDAMVDGADAGRQPQPFGRVQGDRWVQDDRPRDDPRMAKELLYLGSFIHDAGDGAELARR